MKYSPYLCKKNCTCLSNSSITRSKGQKTTQPFNHLFISKRHSLKNVKCWQHCMDNHLRRRFSVTLAIRVRQLLRRQRAEIDSTLVHVVMRSQTGVSLIMCHAAIWILRIHESKRVLDCVFWYSAARLPISPWQRMTYHLKILLSQPVDPSTVGDVLLKSCKIS